MLIALSLLAALAALLVATGSPRRPARVPTPAATLPSTPVIVGTVPARPTANAGLRAPVDAAQLGEAQRIAAGFLAGYVPYLYGRRPAKSLRDLTSSLRAELAHDPPRLTPAQRSRHPRLLALATVGRPSGAVLATATVADGGPAAYPVRLLLTRRDHGWVVISIAS